MLPIYASALINAIKMSPDAFFVFVIFGIGTTVDVFQPLGKRPYISDPLVISLKKKPIYSIASNHNCELHLSDLFVFFVKRFAIVVTSLTVVV